jgi:hypothetical protein
VTRKNRIMICGPKEDGTYVVEFRTAEGDVLSISIPRTETHVSGISKSGCPTGCSSQTLMLNKRAARNGGPLYRTQTGLRC